MIIQENDKIMTAREAAAFLKINKQTLTRWAKDGKVKCFTVGKRKDRRFRLSDIEELLK